MATSKATNPSIQIHTLKQGMVTLRLLGQTPLYFNSMGSKATRDLLLGSRKKTAAEKLDIKHNPELEYRESMYTKSEGETALYFPAAGVKGAMATAALETEGIKKTSVQRLIFLPESKMQIWGKPTLKMDIVRSADMNRTPDVRTRAFLPEWCAEVTIKFVTPTLSRDSIVSLLANAEHIVAWRLSPRRARVFRYMDRCKFREDAERRTRVLGSCNAAGQRSSRVSH